MAVLPQHYSVVRRRKYRDASGAAMTRMSTDQASEASMGCCIGQALADPSLSLRDRVRMACSLGAVFGGLLMAGDAFDNVSSAELGSRVRDAVLDLLADPGA